jgi:Peptidoglycan-binding protein, CsiV
MFYRKPHRRLTAIVLVLLSGVAVGAAEAPPDDADPAAETRTVYVVELIVFSHQAGLAGSEERWPPEIETLPWQDAVVPKPAATSPDEASEFGDPVDATGRELDSPATQEQLDDEVLGRSFELAPRPDVWIATADQIVLGDALSRLQRDPRFDVLLHTAWQQEGIPQEDSFAVMVSDVPLDLYFPTDEELLADSEMAPGEALEPDIDANNAAASAVDATDKPVEDQASTSGDRGANDLVMIDTSTSPYDDPTARLVGQVRVYLERYLHLQLDLIYDTNLIPAPSQLLVPSEVEAGRTELVAADPKDQPVTIERVDRSDRRRDPGRPEGRGGAFSIQKESGPQSLRVRLVESRRMRSTEVHYFDHPVIGVVATITPWEIPVEPSDDELVGPESGTVGTP